MMYIYVEGYQIKWRVLSSPMDIYFVGKVYHSGMQNHPVWRLAIVSISSNIYIQVVGILICSTKLDTGV